MIYQSYIKRLLDIVVSLLTLILLTPLFIVVAISIKLSSKGDIFFKQTRIGLNGKPFKIYKFRTMDVNPNRELNQTTSADPEVFPLGKVLRRLKIDELPQVFNVLKGDMSIIGPRPCLQQTYDEMPAWARERFNVRPGLSGLAQVNGNITLSWEDRWKYDTTYIKKPSLKKDLAIIGKTFLVVLFGEHKFRRTK